MTDSFYPSMREALKAKPAHKYEMRPGNGESYTFMDIVTASVMSHELCGKLYRIDRDNTRVNSFIRVPIEPLAYDIALDCANRIPVPPNNDAGCRPIFGT